MAPESDGPSPHEVWTYPANEAMDTPLTLSIRVQFDRFLAPSTAVRGSICLQPSSLRPDGGLDQCVGAGFAPKYDPVDRVAVWEIHGELIPLTRYNVRIVAPTGPQDPNGIRAFDGAPLAKEIRFAFTTTCKVGPESPACVPGVGLPEPWRAVGFCPSAGPSAKVPGAPGAILSGCAAGGTCHGAKSASQGPVGSVFRLDDDGNGGGLEGAVKRLSDKGIVATETATDPDPNAPNRVSAGPFGRNMPYLDATNPGNSYLIYKLIAAMAPPCVADDPTSTQCRAGASPPLVDSWVPPGAWQPPLAGENDRLRERLRGSGMPYGGTIAYSDVLTMSAWVALGAKAEHCAE